MITLTHDNFQEEVLEATVPVLVDFWASWCRPCLMLAPTLDKVSDKLKGRAYVGKVDVDAETQLAARYNVRAMPTLLFFKNGQVVDMIVGMATQAQLVRKLEGLTDA